MNSVFSSKYGNSEPFPLAPVLEIGFQVEGEEPCDRQGSPRAPETAQRAGSRRRERTILPSLPPSLSRGHRRGIRTTGASRASVQTSRATKSSNEVGEVDEKRGSLVSLAGRCSVERPVSIPTAHKITFNTGNNDLCKGRLPNPTCFFQKREVFDTSTVVVRLFSSHSIETLCSEKVFKRIGRDRRLGKSITNRPRPDGLDVMSHE